MGRCLILPTLPLSSPGPSSFGDLVRPPREAGGGTNEIGAGLQRRAAGELGVFELLDGGELAVDEAGVGKQPQMLSRLQFQRLRRQEQQVGAIRFPETASRQGMGSAPFAE
jgi:hypothetical protein